MPTNIASHLARQLGAGAEETSRVLEELVLEIRQSVMAEGQYNLPGLGTFRQFNGRIGFEPEQGLALTMNQRYAGLEPLVVNTAELTPEAPAEDEMEVETTPEAELYPPEAPAFAIHPDDAPALEEEPAPLPAHEAGAFLEPPFVTAANAEEDPTGPTEALPEMTVHEEPELESEPFHQQTASSLIEEDEAEEDEDLPEDAFAETEDDSVLPTRELAATPFFSWTDEAEEPEHEESADISTEEEASYTYEPEELPSSEHEDAFAEAYEERMPETSEEEVLAHDIVEPAPDRLYAEEEPLSFTEADPSFHAEPIEDTYAPYVPPYAAGPVAEETAEPVRPVRKPVEPVSEGKGFRPVWLIGGLVLAGIIGALAYTMTRPQGEPVSPAIVEAQPPLVAPSDTATALVPLADSAATVAEEPAAPEPEDGIDVSRGGLTLVVASVTDREGAMQVAQQYRDQGINTIIFHGAYGGVTRYRVGVGQFTDANSAASERENLPASVPRDAWLMPIRNNMDVIR